MGIPVVETGDRWHYDIGQKVPLTLDRENVPPGFLRQVRVAVFNRMHAQLERTADGWLISDLESTNGTRVNGWRVRGKVPVHPGDLVSFGSLEVVFT